MASNGVKSTESLGPHHGFETEHNISRSSWHSLPVRFEDMASAPTQDPRTALFHGHDHEGVADRARHLADDDVPSDHKDDSYVNKNASKQLEKMITPYLAQHIPKQYHPVGHPVGGKQEPQNAPSSANTKFCYRHRPDLLCRRQADEPTMDQLQEELAKESQEDQQSIANVWSLFSAAPSKHRNLMLQGILAQCCFPQLSFISSSVRNLIKIDFLSALPNELCYQILGLLDTGSLCKAAQVSRRWRQLADDDVVWHKMCEQHIGQKCTKCGWGLPLLEQARLKKEKKLMEMRAVGKGLNGPPPSTTALTETSASTGTKRAASSSPESASKRSCTETLRDQQESYFDHPKRRPWKDVYKDRFKVGTNWKYGRYSTKILKGHTNGVMCLQFDDKTLFSGSYDCTIKAWDLETGEEKLTLTGHTQGIRCLHYDEGYVISGSLDNSIKIWDYRTGKCVRTLYGHSKAVIGLHMAGRLLASASADTSIQIHDFTPNSTDRFYLTGHDDWVNSVRIDLPSMTLFSASDDCTIRLWDLKTRKCIKVFEGHVGQVQQVLPLPPDFELDEQAFAAHSSNDTSDTASLASDAQNVPAADPRSPELPDEPFFPDDVDRPAPPPFFLTAALDGTVRLWRTASGRCIHRFFGHVEGVWSLAADSLRLVTGAEDKLVKIWDPRTGKCERTIVGHTGPVNSVGLSDSRLISGSEDGTIRVMSFLEADDTENTSHD